MKNKNLFIAILLSITVFGCKRIAIVTPNFEVTTDKTSYKASDTVRFLFSGDADYITYYSGEAGFDYANKDRQNANGIPQLQFTSTRTVGSQENTLMLLATNDLDTNDSLAVRNAAWTDITSRAVLSTGASTASGIVNLADFAKPGKKLTLAFKYLGYKDASAQRKWVIGSFNVDNVLPDQTVAPVTTIALAYWSSFSIKGNAVKWVIPTASTSLTITGGNKANSEENEDWVVTKPLDLTAISKDIGVPIKSINNVTLPYYDQVYTKAGTYTVTFVAFNRGMEEQQKEIIRQVTVTVNP